MTETVFVVPFGKRGERRAGKRPGGEGYPSRAPGTWLRKELGRSGQVCSPFARPFGAGLRQPEYQGQTAMERPGARAAAQVCAPNRPAPEPKGRCLPDLAAAVPRP